jgi:Ca-activated chloride channel homolog
VVRKDRGKIATIVVLTDGEDTDNGLTLDELLAKVRAESESQGVRVFTIGHGKEAEKGMLQAIASAKQTHFYEGNPANIRTVFRDISTFF